MDTLLNVFGPPPGPAGGPIVLSLVARWTVLLSLAWAAHAALAGRNPRWRVALWRAVAIGAAAVPFLACSSPVIRWPLPDAGRAPIPPVTAPPGTFADAPD